MATIASRRLRKLTEKDVAKIRELAATIPRAELAERFGIARGTVSKIATGKLHAPVPK